MASSRNRRASFILRRRQNPDRYVVLFNLTEMSNRDKEISVGSGIHRFDTKQEALDYIANKARAYPKHTIKDRTEYGVGDCSSYISDGIHNT